MGRKATAVLLEVIAVSKKKRHHLRVSISKPYGTQKGDWACWFDLRGIEEAEEHREYFGVDGLQALILSLFYLRSVLRHLRKKGYVFRELHSDEKIDPESYFEVFEKSA